MLSYLHEPIASKKFTALAIYVFTLRYIKLLYSEKAKGRDYCEMRQWGMDSCGFR
jgi:hypothetical protein